MMTKALGSKPKEAPPAMQDGRYAQQRSAPRETPQEQRGAGWGVFKSRSGVSLKPTAPPFFAKPVF